MQMEEKSSKLSILRKYLVLIYVSGVIVILDQITKSIVRANLEIGEAWSPWIWLEPYVRIVHWKNTGVVLGLLQGFNDVFSILAIVVAIAILYYFPQVPREDRILRLAMAMQFGGAVGNLIDRVTIGWVTDFISVGTFPVFNVADSSISIGVAILVLGVWIKDRRQKAGVEAVADPVSEESS
jgi:signal peptidase II